MVLCMQRGQFGHLQWPTPTPQWRDDDASAQRPMLSVEIPAKPLVVLAAENCSMSSRTTIPQGLVWHRIDVWQGLLKFQHRSLADAQQALMGTIEVRD